VQLILDRIFDRDDVLFGRVDAAQTGIERGRLARAGRSGRENNAVALMNQPLDLRQIFGREAETIDVYIDQRLLPIEQSQHDALAESSGNCRDANIDIAARDPQPDASVLRQPFSPRY